MAHSSIAQALVSIPIIIGFIVITPANAQVDTAVAPESVGLSSVSLDQITERLNSQIEQGTLPGTISLVVRRGKVVHHRILGRRDLEADLPMQADTIFRIYSMTKPITTVAALILYEDGRIALDDPISNYLPALQNLQVYDPSAADGSNRAPADRPIRIRDLLNHTSGFVYGYSDATPVEALYKKADILNRRGTLDDMIQKLKHLPLDHQPGTKWHYGVSTDVLGRIVEVASGMPLDTFCRERIFQPLGMVDTGFHVADDKRSRFASIYALDANKHLKPWGGTIETTTYYPPITFFSGGGGAVSTAPDYLRFAQMLLGRGTLGETRILRAETVDLMTSNQLDGEYRPGWGYGFGVQICTDVERSGQSGSVGSFSWGGGGNTFFFVDPKEDLIAMVWTQLSGSSPISREFREQVYASLQEK